MDIFQDNPLSDKQREKSGAWTFEKYDYQYHWALCRIIKEHELHNEYALFVEYHEDVTLAKSLNINEVEFEFNQVKAISGSPLNLNNLIKIKKKEKNSILGKLIGNYNSMQYKDKITQLNIVATCGYNFQLSEIGKDLEIIRKSDFTDTSLTTLKDSLKNELGIEDIPLCLQFIVPDILPENIREVSIGKISDLITKLYPNCHYKPLNIYRALIDDLHKKGKNRFDYNRWEEAIKAKAITSQQVENVIQLYSNNQNDFDFKQGVNEVIADLNIKHPQKRKITGLIDNLYIEYLTNQSSNIRKTIESIKSKISTILDSNPSCEMSFIVEQCVNEKVLEKKLSYYEKLTYIIFSYMIGETV